MAQESSWPAVAYEKLDWRSEDDDAASRRERRRHQGPYQAAVPPAISARSLVLPTEIAAVVGEASSEIARFDAEMGREIAPFSAILLRTESTASSKIENLTASARAIGEAELGPTGKRNAAEIVANTRTMKAALELAGDLDANSILAMHAALMSGTDPARAGRWRQEQVWIGGGDLGPHQAVFVPPHHTRVEQCIEDLIRYADRDDVPVLVQVAVAHAQFEIIHPFSDGNGRTGRALVQALLVGKRLTRNVTVPVSAGLLANTDAYFSALGSYRQGDPYPVVKQFSEAAFRAIANGRMLIQELRGIRDGWARRIEARKDSAVWRLLDLLLRRPVLNAHVVSSELGIDAGNVNRYVRPLIEKGILTGSDSRRNQIWRSVQVLTALDAFAARAGRRTSGAPAPDEGVSADHTQAAE